MEASRKIIIMCFFVVSVQIVQGVEVGRARRVGVGGVVLAGSDWRLGSGIMHSYTCTGSVGSSAFCCIRSHRLVLYLHMHIEVNV